MSDTPDRIEELLGRLTRLLDRLEALPEPCPTPDGMPLLLTIRTAAALLCCGRTHVYELMNRGTLEYLKDGSCRRVVKSSLMAYIRRHTRKAKGLHTEGGES